MSVIIVPISENDQTQLFSDFALKPANHRVIYETDTIYSAKIFINTEFETEKYEHLEKLNVRSEKLRKLGYEVAQTGRSIKAPLLVLSSKFPEKDTQPFSEGLFFGSWAYKQTERAEYPEYSVESEKHLTIFETTRKTCEIQNFSRMLQETPSNLMTPRIFAQRIAEQVKTWGLEEKVEVFERGVDWIKEQKMGSFLGVAMGCIEENPPVFLEVHINRNNADQKPDLSFVGKGITFDAGGISIKLDQTGMMGMKSDMGGAAVTMATVLGAAWLNLTDKYICCLTPLTDNMPDGRALKLGDVLTASNGKTIEIYNTDAEGRLVMADALVYADKVLKSKMIIDVATLTGSIVISLSDSACGIISRNSKLAQKVCVSGFETGERVFELPLYGMFKERMTKSDVADLRNLSGIKGAGALTAAAFLSEFVEIDDWAHIDIAGVFINNKGGCEYMKHGSMTGKPVRTLLKFVQDYVN